MYAAGHHITWYNEVRYLGIHIISSRVFKCSLTHAKQSFYRAANAIFGKIGRIVSEEVTLHLMKSKCIPVLLYGLEVCPLNVSDMRSLDFVINRFFMKLLNYRPISLTSVFCKLLERVIHTQMLHTVKTENSSSVKGCNTNLSTFLTCIKCSYICT